MSVAIHSAHGIHLIADLHGVFPQALTDAIALEAHLRAAAKAAGARVLSAHFHGFGNRVGVTGVLLLAESHISIHTWPEHGYAALDIFMCGPTQPERALEEIKRRLGATRCERREVVRGGV